ncbi:MAG: carbon-nitrogen hydrolase family protein [Clostridia bacterium]|nr:carbon-nitrogen hydrolase family protein [Clostridia bacterium]
MELCISLLQIPRGDSPEEAMQLGEAACRKARAAGADLALFPEMFSTGYCIPQEKKALRAAAIGRDHPFLRHFADLAKELSMAIAVTFLEAFEPAPRNSVMLFDRKGREVLCYAKVHTCDFGDERVLTPGDELPVAELDLGKGSVRVGCMICYDREFPETARLLMLKGAEVILVPNACPMEINRLSQLRARAFENMLAVATCNYPAVVPDCNGGSSVFDGIVYLPHLSGSRDTCLGMASEEEEILTVSLPMDTLREYRESEVHGNAYRRPSLYGALTEERVEAPFLRPDRRK